MIVTLILILTGSNIKYYNLFKNKFGNLFQDPEI